MHEKVELFLCQLGSLLSGTRPFKTTVLESAVQQQKTVSHPQEALAAICALSAEEEQGSLLVRIQFTHTSHAKRTLKTA